MYNRDIFSNFYFSKFNIIMWLKASQDDIINLICSKGNLKLHQWSVSFTFNVPTKSLKWTSNWPVAKLVEACARNATAKHAWIVWLDRTAIYGRITAILRPNMVILSSQTVNACFVLAFRTQASTRFVTGQFAFMSHVKRLYEPFSNSFKLIEKKW